MLRQIIEDCVHDALGEDDLRDCAWHTSLQKVLALAQHASGRPGLVRFHEFHGRIMAHGDVAVEQALNLKLFLYSTH